MKRTIIFLIILLALGCHHKEVVGTPNVTVLPTPAVTPATTSLPTAMTLTNSDGISIFEFERIRNFNLINGTYTEWSSVFAGGFKFEYCNKEIEIIYMPSGYFKGWHERLWIKSDSLGLHFTIINTNGVLKWYDSSDHYYKNVFSKQESVRNLKLLVHKVTFDSQGFKNQKQQ